MSSDGKKMNLSDTVKVLDQGNIAEADALNASQFKTAELRLQILQVQLETEQLYLKQEQHRLERLSKNNERRPI